MRIITINGEPHRVRRMRPGDVVPGLLACETEGRRVWRVLCADGGDLVLRNARHPGLLAAYPAATFHDEFMFVEP